jgi:hypothetical protein
MATPDDTTADTPEVTPEEAARKLTKELREKGQPPDEMMRFTQVQVVGIEGGMPDAEVDAGIDFARQKGWLVDHPKLGPDWVIVTKVGLDNGNA